MILLLDIGNTRIKWGELDDGILGVAGSIAHRGVDLAAALDRAWTALPVPARILASNVAGKGLAGALDAWSAARWGVVPEYVASAAQCLGVRNAYPRPERLGVDRWISLLAAHRHYPGAALIVDCGSAVTIDYLAADGRHLGGLIAPGLSTMHRSLTAGEITLDGGDGAYPSELPPLTRDTPEAVTYGIAHCLAGFLDRINAILQGTMGPDFTRIITGGDAGRLRPVLADPYVHEPHLVLKGLAAVATSGPEGGGS